MTGTGTKEGRKPLPPLTGAVELYLSGISVQEISAIFLAGKDRGEKNLRKYGVLAPIFQAQHKANRAMCRRIKSDQEHHI
jgi:hypothetical protein